MLVWWQAVVLSMGASLAPSLSPGLHGGDDRKMEMEEARADVKTQNRLEADDECFDAARQSAVQHATAAAMASDLSRRKTQEKRCR